MSTSEDEPRKGRGRPRTPGAEKRIIDAALEEYGQHGWAGFTMDGVARRAGVGKSTVYLRWQDKDTLLTDAVGTRGNLLPAVDTGTARGDLEALAINLFEHNLEPAGWATLRVVIDAAGAPQRLGRLITEVSTPQLELVEGIIARGIERGELATGTQAVELGQCIYGSALMQTMTVRLEGRTLDRAEIEDRARTLVDVLLQGALRREPGE